MSSSYTVDDKTGELRLTQLRTDLRDQVLKTSAGAVDDLGEAVLEGKPVRILQSRKGKRITTVWIDPKTKLPVQTEGEIKLKACVMSFFKDADVKQVDTNFQWGVEIDEALLSPEIPEDFQELSLPSKATVGAVASGVVLAGIAPWCILIRRRCRHRKVCAMK